MKRITILLLVFFSSQLARAQAGYLDETFGKYGFVFAETSGFSEYALSVAVMPDGKIFQCSSATNENGSYGRLILRRYNPNGSIDSSFADNGAYISNDITSFVSAKIFPYSDGRTLVVGQIASGYISNGKIQYSPFILRLLSNGNVDTSFGKNGVISEYHHGVSEEYCSARIENDGIIVIIGARGDTGKMLPVVTKLNSNGEKLSSFGDEGTVSVYSSTEPIFIADADINSSGDCVFAGSYGPEGFKNTIIIRSNIHGELVPSFGNNGVVRVANFDTDEEVRSVKIATDKSLLFLVSEIVELYGRSCIIKLASDGSFDLQFGSWGGALYPWRVEGRRALSFALDSSSNVIVAGYGGEYYGTAFCFLKDGSYNQMFGDSGEIIMSPSDYHGNFDVVVQSDGKYVLVGWSYSRGSLTRSVICRLIPPQLSINSDVHTTVFSLSLYPTPSTDYCTATYILPASSECTMTLRDESGREVRTFVQDEYRTAGKQDEDIDLRGLASGVYFLSIEHDDKTETAKLIKQ